MYKKGHIHFIGIGGIGMSGIANVLYSQGYQISGCELDIEQVSVQNLKKIGCTIFHGNNTEYCSDPTIDILVYSSAIKTDNPEIIQAQAKGIPTITRALMLAELMRTKFSIAIAGSHGKTTTSSIVSHLLIESNMDPTIIIGGHFENISSNARLGTGAFLVAEADESDKSFLRLYPTIALVTNIDLEHLDTYTNLDDIKSNFQAFLSNLPFYGKAFVCTDDPHLNSLLPLNHIKTIKYGTSLEHTDLCAQNILLEKDYSSFMVYCNKTKITLGDITMPMPGKHNVLNLLGALAIAIDLGIPFSTLKKAMSNFKGIDRRFSFKGFYKNSLIYDDYGHHPTEIYNTLLVARKACPGNLIVIFQPHRYSRTKKLWEDFINVFAYSSIDHLIITDIYSASETKIPGIDTQSLVKAIQHKQPSCMISYIPATNNFAQIKDKLETIISNQDLILFLGAGKVNKLIPNLK